MPNRSHRWLKFARWELWGQCRKHASPEGTTTSWIQSFVISKGWGEARNSYFYIKCYLLPHTRTHHIREKRKRFDLQVIKSTRLVSHEFVISISDCILMTWFFTYLFSENGCLKWAGNPDSPPISYDLRPITGYLYAAFFFFFFSSLRVWVWKIYSTEWSTENGLTAWALSSVPVPDRTTRCWLRSPRVERNCYGGQGENPGFCPQKVRARGKSMQAEPLLPLLSTWLP